MSALDHYREAERLMRDTGWEDPVNVAHAQVHATLALVGATLLASTTCYTMARDSLFDAVTE